ncbi:flavodoxin family protein [archaeon]|nr:flavodoxin family protein [archaeon]
MVRVLGINGSPRKYGGVAALLEVALEAARREGATTEMVHLVDYRIEPCIGCLSDEDTVCRPPCVIKDDMRKLYPLIEAADALIFATPVYWYGPSGLFKNFFDRLTVFENLILIEGRSRLEGKVAALIAVGNEAGVIATTAPLLTALVHMGLAVPPWGFTYFNEPRNPLSDPLTVLDAANLGRCVVLLTKALKAASPPYWYSPNIEWLPSAIKGILRSLDQLRFKQLQKRKISFDRVLKKKNKLRDADGGE